MPETSVDQKMHRSIHWFRKGLRLHDNPSLLAACQNASQVHPVFILDPWFVKHGRVGVNRWRFLVQSLQNLDESLKKLNLRYRNINPDSMLNLNLVWKIN